MPKLTGKGAIWAGLLGTPVLLVALIVALGAAAAPAKQTSSQTKASTSAGTANAAVTVSSNQNSADTYRYWTAKRMASAKPVMPTVGANDSRSILSDGPTGAPGTSPGLPPSGRDGLRQAPGAGLSGGRPDIECYECFVPYTQYYYFARYLSYPTSTVAKMFFTNNGSNYVCSASVLYTNVVWTAGHCVANTDGSHQFSTNVLICPSYANGINPAQGCWGAVQEYVFTIWLNTGSFEWDMGGITMSNCGTVHCNDIGNSTGYLGIAWNFARNQNYTAFGYPQGSPFNGQYIVTTQSQFGYEESDGNNQGGPNSQSIGSSQTGGSSGGPWIWQWGSNNYLNGHNDWRYTALPDQMNSPYFDQRACILANAAGRPLTC